MRPLLKALDAMATLLVAALTLPPAALLAWLDRWLEGSSEPA